MTTNSTNSTNSMKTITSHDAQALFTRVDITSFAFSNGVPTDCDIVFDLRKLPNPAEHEELRACNGTDASVIASITTSSFKFDTFFASLTEELRSLLEKVHLSGKRTAKVGLGCHAGIHRSVYCATRVGSWIEAQTEIVVCSKTRHRDCFVDSANPMGFEAVRPRASSAPAQLERNDAVAAPALRTVRRATTVPILLGVVPVDTVWTSVYDTETGLHQTVCKSNNSCSTALLLNGCLGKKKGLALRRSQTMGHKGTTDLTASIVKTPHHHRTGSPTKMCSPTKTCGISNLSLQFDVATLMEAAPAN